MQVVSCLLMSDSTWTETFSYLFPPFKPQTTEMTTTGANRIKRPLCWVPHTPHHLPTLCSAIPNVTMAQLRVMALLLPHTCSGRNNVPRDLVYSYIVTLLLA